MSGVEEAVAVLTAVGGMIGVAGSAASALSSLVPIHALVSSQLDEKEKDRNRIYVQFGSELTKLEVIVGQAERLHDASLSPSSKDSSPSSKEPSSPFRGNKLYNCAVLSGSSGFHPIVATTDLSAEVDNIVLLSTTSGESLFATMDRLSLGLYLTWKDEYGLISTSNSKHRLYPHRTQYTSVMARYWRLCRAWGIECVVKEIELKRGVFLRKNSNTSAEKIETTKKKYRSHFSAAIRGSTKTEGPVYLLDDGNPQTKDELLDSLLGSEDKGGTRSDATGSEKDSGKDVDDEVVMAEFWDV